MNKYVLGAVALLAFGAPGVAAAQSGYVDASYQTTEIDTPLGDADGDGWAVGGATAWGGEGSLGVQLDGQVGSTEFDGGDVSNWNVGGHLFTRNSGYLVGGFANFGNVDVDGLGDSDFWTVGLEGQFYLARTTLDGAVSYSEGDDVDLEFTGVDLGLTHFLTDNFSVGGNLGFGTAEGGGSDADVTSFGVGAEWQMAAAPISIFGGYQRAEIEDADVETDALSVGVRYNWGGTLFDRNRSGASLGRGAGASRVIGLVL